MKKLISITIFYICILSYQNIAQITESNIINKYKSLSLDQLLGLTVTSASKIEETISNAPGVLTLVPQKHIGIFGWESINDILFSQPGFFQSYDYERRTVGFRGLFESWNNNHLLMLVDGIPFNDNQYGSAYTWEITPLIFIKSLEILRGPGSALYGSNATNGVLNIETIEPSILDDSNFRFKYGTHKSYSLDALFTNDFKYFSTVLSFSRYKTEGFEYSTYDDTWQQGRGGSPQKIKVKDTRSGNYVFVKAKGQNSLKDFTFQYHFQDWTYETGHGWLWMIPDIHENMNEHRNIFVLSYKKQNDKSVNNEFSIRYQNHFINWNIMESPPDVFGGIYPQGMIENLKTSTSDLWGRMQFSFKLKDEASIITGFETQVFYYSSDDEEHYSNINLNDPSYPPNANSKFIKINPWLEWINHKPVSTLAGYMQYSSGKSISDQFKIVAGVRYDYQYFNFNAIDKQGKPTENKSFDQISPRFSVIYKPNSKLALKFLYGHAFRTPSITELFGANTWTLAPGIRNVIPETLTNMEFAADYKMSSHLNLRINVFLTDFNNKTAYSIGEITQVVNLYSTLHTGLETELIFQFKNGSGFFNFSFVDRIDEKIGSGQEELIYKSNELTWAPSILFNLGLSYNVNRFIFSARLKFQGEVKRRESDSFIDVYEILRPSIIDEWVNLDFKAIYKINSYLNFELDIKNLFDSEQFVVKNFSFPFDYRLSERRIFLGLGVTF